MPRYAKFLFAFLLTGLFCTWASFFLLLYVKGIPNFTPNASRLTPIVATEQVIITPETSETPYSSALSGTSTPTLSLPDVTPTATNTTSLPTDVTSVLWALLERQKSIHGLMYEFGR